MTVRRGSLDREGDEAVARASRPVSLVTQTVSLRRR